LQKFPLISRFLRALFVRGAGFGAAVRWVRGGLALPIFQLPHHIPMIGARDEGIF